MKKKVLTIGATTAVSVSLGYLFLLSWLFGLLASKYVAGRSTGRQGKLRSVVVPFRSWRIHLHHWFYSLCLIGLSTVFGLYLLSPTITYGVLGGAVFQGIYFYDDWHIFARRKQKAG